VHEAPHGRFYLSAQLVPTFEGATHDDDGPCFYIFVLRPQTGDSLFHAQILDPFKINFDHVKKWLSHCEHAHGSACGVADWEPCRRRFMFWTLDTRHNVLRPTSTSDRFVVLSYVTGGIAIPRPADTSSDFFKLLDKKANLARLLRNLPKTLQDAIAVVRAIDEDLLWIDALCIPPDRDDRAKHIVNMDCIYNAASLTIVAANSKRASAGLPGSPGTLRKQVQHTAQVTPNLTLCLGITSTIKEVEDSHWNHRGWTFQERLLSKRLVIFAHNTVY
jgi:hypothetical protein